MPVLEKKKLEKIVVDGIVKEFGPDAFGDPDDVNPSEFKTSMFFDSFERVKIKSVCSDEKGRPVWVLPMPEDFQMLGQTGIRDVKKRKARLAAQERDLGVCSCVAIDDSPRCVFGFFRTPCSVDGVAFDLVD